MESQFRTVIRQKIIDAQAAPLPVLTRQDVWLPAVKGKATVVIGMRRAGKTSLLWQILADRVANDMPREGLLYFSFEDERLADMQVQDLDLLVETFYQLNPSWRDARRATFFWMKYSLCLAGSYLPGVCWTAKTLIFSLWVVSSSAFA